VLIDRNPTVIPEQNAPVIVQTCLTNFYVKRASNFAKIMDRQVCSSHVLLLHHAFNASYYRSLIDRVVLSYHPLMFPRAISGYMAFIKAIAQFYLGWDILNQAKLLIAASFWVLIIGLGKYG